MLCQQDTAVVLAVRELGFELHHGCLGAGHGPFLEDRRLRHLGGNWVKL